MKSWFGNAFQPPEKDDSRRVSIQVEWLRRPKSRNFVAPHEVYERLEDVNN